MPHCNAVKFSKSISRVFEITARPKKRRRFCRLRLTGSVRVGHADQIVRIDVIELIARTLVEQVGVDPVGSQQRDPLLALGPLLLQPRQFGGQRDDLLIELLPRIQPILAGIGIDAEIAAAIV
jgi:hypothetical protein